MDALPHLKDATKLLDSAAKKLLKEGKKKEAVFLHCLYDPLALEDLENVTADELAEIALHSFKGVGKRTSQSHTISIWDPEDSGEPDSYSSRVTIVDIINDNMPFLFDSIIGVFQRNHYDIHMSAHPVIYTERTKTGQLKSFEPRHEDAPEGARSESFIQIHIDRLDDGPERQRLMDRIDQVLSDVALAVKDWKTMLERVDDVINSNNMKAAVPEHVADEAVEFLKWLCENNFTFLGMRELVCEEGFTTGLLEPDPDSGLGILTDPGRLLLAKGRETGNVSTDVREFLNAPRPVMIMKADMKTGVHRPGYLDYIGVKRYSKDGLLIGELRIGGLFTSTAYTQSVKSIPILRDRASNTFNRLGYRPGSHSGKSLLNILETFPRDELFQIDVETLGSHVKAILKLGEKPRVRVLCRHDRYDRFYSVLVYVPRDRYDSNIRMRIGEYLRKAFDGRLSAFYPDFPEGVLARVHYIIGRNPGTPPAVDFKKIEQDILEITRNWQDQLIETISRNDSRSKAVALLEKYKSAFNRAYQEAYNSQSARFDIEIAESLSSENPLGLAIYRRADDDFNTCSLKVMHLGGAIPLSERVPLLENMGFSVVNERTYRIKPRGLREMIYLHDMTILRADGGPVNLDILEEPILECFHAAWSGKIESDGYNALVTLGGLNWRDITILRAISRYLRQLRLPYSQDYMWDVLCRNAEIAQWLVKLFYARFAIDVRDEKAASRVDRDLLTRLEAVKSLDDDQILRRFRDVILASLRTNFFQSNPGGNPDSVLSLKINPRALSNIPEPRPYREIFVYSPRVEGVHLRFGPVARGGLRWSDRPQDFRTEVLGLVKAQQVKNAVIVPVGAKGGFFPKRLPTTGDRQAFIEEGTSAYKLFISSLLEITDNLDGEKIIPPRDVVQHDDGDPYLVVAADKGTATFSDTANGIAESKGFWLGDAFASGGSAGYDHKKMGITARGAWEAVKRHFREMDRDIQTEPFTAAGCGDMSGDVFGNGMLLSKATKLIAAFDHRDIFFDPDPDPAKSWDERKRLFDMGRSSWQHYDPKLISKGGGVFSRAEKSIKLSPQMKARLGLKSASATPNAVINAILKMQVDLMWFGGIGTYIRSSTEADADVGDRGNDTIRITAKEARCKVIGEGANLGVTQKGRIEFNQLGGRCNSDAIDNSAGVNSSDVEVNIKIALGAAERAGKLTRAKRNKLLSSMTDDVADLVLRNNYLQTLSVTLSQNRGFEDFGYQTRLMQDLENRDLLDRDVEDLPDDEVIHERLEKGRLLTRAEIGVLLAYSKLTLFDELVASDLPDDPYLAVDLYRYFPQAMQKSYKSEIENHRLRREIIATFLANSMINRGGCTYLTRIKDQTGATVPDIARAFLMVRDGFRLTSLNNEIDALDTKIPSQTQLKLYEAIQELVLSETRWFLRNGDFSVGMTDPVKRFGTAVQKLLPKIDQYLPPYIATSIESTASSYIKKGVPEDLAIRIAKLPVATTIPDIVLVSDSAGSKLEATANAYFRVTETFKVGRIDDSARAMKPKDYYDALALERARSNLAEAQRAITASVVNAGGGEKGMMKWLAKSGDLVANTQKAIEETLDGKPSVSRLTVASNLLSDLAKR